MNLASLFEQTEKLYGLPSGYLSRTAQIESGGNPNAKNPRSSAGGLFQFIDSTARNYGLTNKFDPIQATDAAGRLARDNANALRGVLGRDPTGGELYLAHQQGSGGAAKLLRNASAPASSVVGSAAIGLNGGRSGMTAGDFANQWINKFGGARGADTLVGGAGSDTLQTGGAMADAGPKQSRAVGGLGGLGGFVPPERQKGLDWAGLLSALGDGLIYGDGRAIGASFDARQEQLEKQYEREYGRARDDWMFGVQRQDRMDERADRKDERQLARDWQQQQFQYQQGQDETANSRAERSLTIQEKEAERLAQGYRIISDPAERANLGIPADDNRPYQVSPQGQVSAIGGVGQAQTPGVEARQRAALAQQYGIDPNSAEGQRFILTGSLPSSDKGVTAGDREAIRDADDMVQNGEATLGLLDQAMKLSGEAYEGPLAGTRATIGSVFGAEGANATREYDNIVTEQALGQLKSIFGSAPTEGERSILLEIQGSSSQPKAVRDKILQRARAAVERRVAYNRDRANELRGGTYYKPRADAPAAPAAPSAPAPSGPAAPAIDDLLKKYGS